MIKQSVTMRKRRGLPLKQILLAIVLGTISVKAKNLSEVFQPTKDFRMKIEIPDDENSIKKYQNYDYILRRHQK